jgi:hypothetical protein
MTLPDATVPPHWQPYAAVDDPDATTAKAKELGGAVFMDPMDVPKVGRIAVLRDPQGATFGISSLTLLHSSLRCNDSSSWPRRRRRQPAAATRAAARGGPGSTPSLDEEGDASGAAGNSDCRDCLVRDP